MSRPIGAIARYIACGGASIAAYDCTVSDGSFVAQVIKQLVASASNGMPALERATAAARLPPIDFAGALPSRELSELSAKLDRLTSISMLSLGSGRRVTFGALLCAASVVGGGLAMWAIITGRWWPTIQAKLESMEVAISVVDAKVDARASELSAQFTQQCSELMTSVATVNASVCALDVKFDRLEKRVADMDEVEKENNRGIRVLCEVVATNFDLRQCPAPVLKRLHDFSGSGTELVESHPQARSVEASRPVERQPSAPTLMQYLTTPSDGRAKC